MGRLFWEGVTMIKIFKWWWAWDYEKIEEWLENMEASGLRLVKTTFDGVRFHFERCTPVKARYCIDYQARLTPEYITLLNDDGWDLYKIGFGWYILRKEYQQQRPELYNNFDGLIARNKSLLRILSVLMIIEAIAIGRLTFSCIETGDEGLRVYLCFIVALVLAFFTSAITNLALQIRKFGNKT
jgi:hypothetical protein